MEVELETQGKQGVYSDLSAISKQKAKSELETGRLLEKIIDKRNIYEAYKRVVSNKGSHGIDGMRVDEPLPYLQEHYSSLSENLLSGKYKLQSVRRVEIPKPSGVSSPTKRKFLGYSFYYGKDGIKFRVYNKSYGNLKDRIRKITNRNISMNFDYRIRKLNKITTG